VQDLDLASDRLSVRRRTLPERAALRQSHAAAAALDEGHAGLLERREALSRSEHTLSGEVAEVAAKAKEVEDTLYSGSVTAPKELEALQEEIRLLRERQSGLEEREMELLEEIDGVEGEMAENRSDRERAESEGGELEAEILRAEGEIDGELVELAERRGGRAGEVPAGILAEYERLRTKERLAGRAAAPLGKGGCGGCNVRLPVMEYNRMREEPEDALICCGSCGRVLVR